MHRYALPAEPIEMTGKDGPTGNQRGKGSETAGRQPFREIPALRKKLNGILA